MYSHATQIKVRYGETDKMGVVYHSHYIEYYEVARTECMRSLGFTYRAMEESGIILPVTKVESKYKDSLYYDDDIQVKATIQEMPGFKIKFYYDVIKDEKVVNEGFTELVFYDVNKKRPCKPPQLLLDRLEPYFSQN